MADPCIETTSDPSDFARPVEQSATVGVYSVPVITIHRESETVQFFSVQDTGAPFEDLGALLRLSPEETLLESVTNTSELEQVYGVELVQLARIASKRRVVR
jgi:hypothetical protein